MNVKGRVKFFNERKGFRSQTQNSGINVFGQITAALSFTLASTSSMGCTSGALCRLWGELICQTESAGTCTSILVGLSVQSTASDPTTGSPACKPLLEHVLQNTGGGTQGGTSYGTIYTSVASLTGKATRLAFFVEATWTSGSGWSSPSLVQLFGPGMKKPCDVVQGISQVNNGTFFSITPTSAVNLMRITGAGYLNMASTGTGCNCSETARLNRNGSLLLQLSAFGQFGASQIFATPFSITVFDNPATTAAVSYSLTATGSFGTTVVNPTITVEEIMGALDLGDEVGSMPMAA